MSENVEKEEGEARAYTLLFKHGAPPLTITSHDDVTAQWIKELESRKSSGEWWLPIRLSAQDGGVFVIPQELIGIIEGAPERMAVRGRQ